jgi:hypothetical protein
MKKVLFLFAVLMASVNLTCTEQATGIITGNDGSVMLLTLIRVKGTYTATVAGPGGMFSLMVLSGIQPKSNRC